MCFDSCGTCKYFRDYREYDRGYCIKIDEHVIAGRAKCEDYVQRSDSGV